MISHFLKNVFYCLLSCQILNGPMSDCIKAKQGKQISSADQRETCYMIDLLIDSFLTVSLSEWGRACDRFGNLIRHYFNDDLLNATNLLKNDFS